MLRQVVECKRVKVQVVMLKLTMGMTGWMSGMSSILLLLVWSDSNSLWAAELTLSWVCLTYVTSSATQTYPRPRRKPPAHPGRILEVVPVFHSRRPPARTGILGSRAKFTLIDGGFR
ncbi:hypothetical protein PAXRUDRAFT_259057 [Paxillus rubicundulus Ve08.2h10]|uniref:Uncharacterized protein n=1 Tax=Paxillus rubicundulus Ve08.2h10 TaxID=930991 RepID=A0A0D0CWI9_9AGAM|nr:hypothetical protein PAXRUDRAFT_259057 [Paxillus rubicundulus Ve08.2h10]